MKVIVRGKNVTITDAIEDKITKKLALLDKYFIMGQDVEAKVLIRTYPFGQKIEVTIPTEYVLLRAEETSDDLYEAIDLVIDKLERQIRKYKTKLSRKSKNNKLAFNINTLESLEETEEEVVIHKKHEEFIQIQNAANDLIEQMESGHFAYADMLEHVESLYERMMTHDAYLEEFEKQKEEIEKKNQEAEELIENINIVLLEIKSEIKNEHLPLVNDSYRDYITDSYNKVEEIKRFKAHKPVVLNELCAKVEGARDVIYKLYDNVHNMIVTAGMVEDAIVYANRYRSMFLEVNTELTKAEVLFRNGEYRNALQVAVDILERLEPGKYEELIKRKEIKSA